ncbi:hypothetical protein C6Y11_10790 [Lactiplantibacillus pentosus]|nr:hypothetical protein [Lactiplantibacillus pentosus]MCT3302440.1 hypothetical protein [Lactiplantibacillus pentosus]PRO76683.1 hypothetical protein C6Y09_16680 [Lactiplantibacillus pentosus]PRO78588.1 hypothetical protein C6Y11_10790 [Lactiplantibacillus pentosus]PRO87798.1 hypothetical protein C6Y12_15155 [Lactiplantibacillus pentosus]
MTETALDEMANRATQGKLAIKDKNRSIHPPKIVVRYYRASILAEKKRAATRAALLKAKLIEEQR